MRKKRTYVKRSSLLDQQTEHEIEHEVEHASPADTVADKMTGAASTAEIAVEKEMQGQEQELAAAAAELSLVPKRWTLFQSL